jgi:hypothetical protein
MAKAGRVCGICSDPALSLKCDGLLASGFSLVQIAEQLGVSKYTVSRHGRHSVTKLSDKDAEKLPANKLDQLYDRCENLYHALAANGDIKASADILKVQARLAEQACQREESRQREAESNKNDPEQQWPTPAMLDNNKKKVDEAYAKAIAEGAIWCPCCGKRPVNPTAALARIQAYMETQNANSN